MDRKANCRPATSDSGDTQSSLDVETPTIPSTDPNKNRSANVSASSPQLLFECNPGQTASIIKRKAMIKELSALYHAECLSYSQKVLDLQRKWEQNSSAGITIAPIRGTKVPQLTYYMAEILMFLGKITPNCSGKMSIDLDLSDNMEYSDLSERDATNMIHAWGVNSGFIDSSCTNLY